jgi:glycerol-3-phosphate O-acyltransferase
MQFIVWLQKLLYLWVRSKSQPGNLPEELGLVPTKPVCYVLRSRSITDLLVLDYHCRQHGLPRPQQSFSDQRSPEKSASYIYLVKPGLVQLRTTSDAPSRLSNLIQQVELTEKDVQIVPVTVIWGRNPGSEDKSVLKLLAFDHENGGILQRLFTVFFHGRNVLCNFGLPISALGMVKDGANVEQTTRKLRRVLRVHFRTQRVAALGPQIYDRNQMIVTLLKTKAIEEAILDESRKKKVSVDRAQERARRYLDEIAANMSTQATGAMEICLRWVMHRIYRGVEIKNGDRVRRYVANHEIVYVPCHRSHMDYLLIGYSIYNLGVMTPHVAAGINLNFWPIGRLLRRAGAFFIRRTFKGNRLYSVVFNEYVHYLMNKGYPIKFFPEGGRSRTGRLLPPKTGMMNMVVEGFVRNPDRPLVFIPVYVGYDKVLEEGSYLNELRGKKKSSESVGQLFKAGKILSGKFGKAYVNFGEPFLLSDRLTQLYPGWQTALKSEDGSGGKLSGAVSAIAREVMIRINNTAIVSPTSLFAIALLSSPKRALPEADLIQFVQSLSDFLLRVPYHEDTILPVASVTVQLSYFEEISGITRFRHPDGDVLYADETEATRLTYYRNNAVHLFAVPSLIAAFFLHNDQMKIQDLLDSCSYLYPFLKEEMFVRFEGVPFTEYFHKCVDGLLDLKLLSLGDEEEAVRRPEVTTPEFALLNLLGRCLGGTIERHAISSALLARQEVSVSFDREEFEKSCQLMSQRIAILNGTNEAEFNDGSLFHAHFDLLRQLHHIERAPEEGRYQITTAAKEAATKSIGLLSQDLRQSIIRSGPVSK